MRPYIINGLIALFVIAVQVNAAQYEAHEWGTFTSLVGSNGMTQDGMFHEDEVLPDFVHGFGETQASAPVTPPIPIPFPDDCHGMKFCFNDRVLRNNVISQKMETPVIYFYAKEKMRVSVNVKFPEGIITDTFPAPVSTFPLSRPDDPDLIIANGESTFDLTITPEDFFFPQKLPAVPEGNIYGHARKVNSNLVTSGSEHERFLFYRGLGRFQPRIQIKSREGSLFIRGDLSSTPKAAFLIDVDQNGDGKLLELSLVPNRENIIGAQTMRGLQDHSEHRTGVRGETARAKLVQALVTSGLKQDEASAMVATWEHGYLKVPGLRLLYVLPRAEVDQILPLTITPAPEKLERVFVGRIEILTDLVELEYLERVLYERDSLSVKSLGRFADSILRRIREVYVEAVARGEIRFSPADLTVFDVLIDRAKNGQD